MARLLLLSCSQLKKRGAEPMTALERYDGPPFKVVRNYLDGEPADAPVIWIISARYGLIPAEEPVPFYDRAMSEKRAIALRPALEEKLQALWATSAFTDVFVYAAGHYLKALEGSWSLLERGARSQRAEGSLGGRLAQLRDWLYGPSETPTILPGSAQPPGAPVEWRGIPIRSTLDEIWELARRGLAQDAEQATAYQAWYVPVGTHRVAPKWLVSQLTGVSVERFRTADALKILSRLGVEVRRVSR